MLIGYEYAKANRDQSVRELGWEFDESTICEVRPVEKTVVVYEKVNPLADSPALNTMLHDPNVKNEEVKEEVAQPAEQATVEAQAADEKTSEE